MPESEKLPSTQGTPEPSSAKITRRKITNVPETRRGTFFNLKDNETLEIISQEPEGSREQMLVYGGHGGGIGFDDLSELLEKKCQIDFSLGVSISEKDAGKARIIGLQKSSDEPQPPVTSIEEALASFKKVLEQEKTAEQSSKTTIPAITKLETATVVDRTETGASPKVEISSVVGEYDSFRAIKLKIEGEESSFIWMQDKNDDGRWKKDYFSKFIGKPEDVRGNIKIPEGSRVDIHALANNGGKNVERIFITGKKDMEISADELRGIIGDGKNSVTIVFMTNGSNEWREMTSWHEEEPGKVRFHSQDYSKATTGLSLREALDLLNKSLGGMPEEKKGLAESKVPPPPVATTATVPAGETLNAVVPEKVQVTKEEKANKDYLEYSEYVEQKRDDEADLLEASVKTPEKVFEKKPGGELTKLGKAQKDYVSATKAWIEAYKLYRQAVNENKDYSSAKSTVNEAEAEYNNAYKASEKKSYDDFRKTDSGGRLGKEKDRCSEALDKAERAFVAASPGKELYEAFERMSDSKKNAARTFGEIRPKWPIAQSAESSPSAAKSQMLGIVEPGVGEMREQFKYDSLVHNFWDGVRETPDKPIFHIGREIRFGIRLDPEELKLWSKSKGNMLSKNPFGEKLTKLEKILLPQKEIQEGFKELLKEHAIEKDGELRTVALQMICENLVRKHAGDFDSSYYVAKHDPRVTSDLIEILKQKKDRDTLNSYPRILDMLLKGSSRNAVLKELANPVSSPAAAP